jgi:DNA-directed RNA polymerase specialized sigma24 family protein
VTDANADDLAAHARGGRRRRGAVRAVVEAVQDPVYQLALRMLGHPADAEDAAQEIVVRGPED